MKNRNPRHKNATITDYAYIPVTNQDSGFRVLE